MCHRAGSYTPYVPSTPILPPVAEADATRDAHGAALGPRRRCRTDSVAPRVPSLVPGGATQSMRMRARRDRHTAGHVSIRGECGRRPVAVTGEDDGRVAFLPVVL